MQAHEIARRLFDMAYPNEPKDTPNEKLKRINEIILEEATDDLKRLPNGSALYELLEIITEV